MGVMGFALTYLDKATATSLPCQKHPKLLALVPVLCGRWDDEEGIHEERPPDQSQSMAILTLAGDFLGLSWAI